ncbi:MAG: tRNA (adenosine(37)-N6)-threonylcarbamoyltransferase complex dimerization subunit type 1 TsaB [Pseudomonadota bacterium]
MRVLGIDTSSEACSVALVDERAETPEQRLLGADTRVLGRGHAEALLPMIAALPDKGRADRIIVGLGPGSFTGVRIAIATARALGIAWGAHVLGYQTLQLLARSAAREAEPLLVCMNGGHGEWFVQAFDAHCAPLAPVRSMRPEQAAAHFDQLHIIGSKAEEFVALRGSGHALSRLPDARHAVDLPESDLTSTLSPIYGRAPDATPQKATSA